MAGTPPGSASPPPAPRHRPHYPGRLPATATASRPPQPSAGAPSSRRAPGRAHPGPGDRDEDRGADRAGDPGPAAAAGGPAGSAPTGPSAPRPREGSGRTCGPRRSARQAAAGPAGMPPPRSAASNSAYRTGRCPAAFPFPHLSHSARCRCTAGANAGRTPVGGSGRKPAGPAEPRSPGPAHGSRRCAAASRQRAAGSGQRPSWRAAADRGTGAVHAGPARIPGFRQAFPGCGPVGRKGHPVRSRAVPQTCGLTVLHILYFTFARCLV